MKFSVDREVLLRPLQLVAGVVERHQTLPILSNLLVRAESEGVLTITATDLSMELVARVDPVSVAQAGQATIPAHKLADIWRSLPEGAQVTVALEQQYAVVRSGRSRFSLATLAAEEFPKLDGVAANATFTLAGTEAADLIDRVGFAMARQDVRFFLNGMLFEVTRPHVRTVATDGHRLSQCTLGKGVEEVAERVQAIVPRKVVQDMRRLFDGKKDEELQFALSERRIRLTCGPYSLSSNLIDGRFPDYERVIPQNPPISICGDRAALSQALQRARILTNEKVPSVKLLLEGEEMTVVANNPEQEEAREELAVEFGGQPMQVAFNVDYLLAVLRVLATETYRISMTEAGSSALIQAQGDESAIYVVMPMKL